MLRVPAAPDHLEDNIRGPSAKHTKSKESFTFISVEVGFNNGLDNRFNLTYLKLANQKTKAKN